MIYNSIHRETQIYKQRDEIMNTQNYKEVWSFLKEMAIDSKNLNLKPIYIGASELLDYIKDNFTTFVTFDEACEIRDRYEQFQSSLFND